MASQHIWNIVLACGFTSTAMHLLTQRREYESQRLRCAAHVAALDDVVRRLRAGEGIDDEELAKIRRRVGLAQRVHVGGTSMEILNEHTTFEESKQKMDPEQEMVSEWNKALDEAAKKPPAKPSLLRALLGLETAGQVAQTLSKTPPTTPPPNPGAARKKPVFY